LLYQSKLPLSFWSYAFLHVVFLINRVPAPVLQNQSPYHLLYDSPPDVTTFKVFGCLCYSSSIQSHKTKLETRSRKSVFLGYKLGFKGYVLYDLHTREILFPSMLFFMNVSYHINQILHLKVLIGSISHLFQLLLTFLLVLTLLLLHPSLTLFPTLNLLLLLQLHLSMTFPLLHQPNILP